MAEIHQSNQNSQRNIPWKLPHWDDREFESNGMSYVGSLDSPKIVWFNNS